MKALVCLVSFLLLTTVSQAAVVFSPAVSYLSFETEEGGVSSESSVTYVDARLGYILPMGIYLGGMYAIENNENNSSYYGGLSVGYYNSGFSLIGTYHLLGEYDPDGASKYTGASGIQVDLSYAFMVASNFALGPQISYRSVEYDKLEVSGVEFDSTRKETQILPMINLWFMF